VSSSLVMRRKRDGSVHVQGGLDGFPDEHEFSARWVARELASGLAQVHLTVNTAHGQMVYEFAGFAELDVTDDEGNPKLNFTGWRCRRVVPTEASKEA
jgi:hypothetical protein